MFDILGLASVLKKNIWSVYPDCNDNIRPLIRRVVEPLICSTIYHLTWRIPCLFCGLERETLTVSPGVTPGQPFEPNHFVPIVYMPASPDELLENYGEPPVKKKRIIEGKKY